MSVELVLMDSSANSFTFVPAMGLDRPGFARSRSGGFGPQPTGSSGSSLYNQSTRQSATTDETLGRPKRRFRSSKLRGDYEKPWLKDPKFKKTKWNAVIVYILVFLTIAGAAVYGYFTVTRGRTGPVSLTHSTDSKSWTDSSLHQQCLILEDNFDELNLDVWSHKVEVMSITMPREHCWEIRY